MGETFLLAGFWLILAGSTFSHAQMATIGTRGSMFTQGRSNDKGVQFLLYADPNDTDCCYVIERGNKESLTTSMYNTSKPLKLLIHGALSNSKTQDDVKLIKDAYLRNNVEANVIMVDYGLLTMSRLPPILSPLSIKQAILSLLRTNLIATEVAHFISFLVNCGVLRGPEDIHLIGFGLGAHIAGTVGQSIRRSTGKVVDRISGLDPSIQFPFRRVLLDSSDAGFVDVTYTAIGRWSFRRRGHVQFFINGGGPHQPNCPRFPTSSIACSHHSANFYFAKSIEKPSGIHACRCIRLFCGSQLLNSRSCTDQIVYGEITDKSNRGNYYVKLN